MTTQNVLILSAYPPGVFQYSIEKALRALGHRVVTAGAAGDMLPELEQALQRYEPGYRYDVLVAADTPLATILAKCPFAPDLILYLEAGIPCLPDGLFEAPCPVVGLLTEDLLHADWYSALIPYFDLALCTWKSTEAAWQAQGHDNVRQWYFGARPAFCVDEGVERTWDVVFLGNLNPRVQRRRLPAIQKILKLRDEGLRVHVATNLFFDAYNRVHNQARIVYHRGITDQVNMRVFEAMGAGCLVIMQRPQDPHDPTTHFFRDRQDVVFADSDDEALDLIRYYAAHDEERRRIAETGRQTVLARHNYPDVVRDLCTRVLAELPSDLAEARRRRLARHGKDPRRHALDRARYFVKFGALEAALTQLRAVPAIQDDVEALTLLGVLFATAGQPERALPPLELACRLDPQAPLARFNRAAVGLAFQQPEAARWAAEALEVLAQPSAATAVEGLWFAPPYERFSLEAAETHVRHPRGPERDAVLATLARYRLHHALGDLHLEQGRAADALAQYDAALALVADDGYVVHARARARAALGQPEALVIEDLARAVALEPFFTQAQLDLADVLQGAGRLDEAFAPLWDVVRHTPLWQAPPALCLRTGELALALGRQVEAGLAFDAALAQAPDDPELQARVSQALARTTTRASIVMAVENDARLAQRAIVSLQEHAAGHELLIVQRGSGRGLDAFLRLVSGSVRVLPGSVSLPADWTRAAEEASGSHLVFLDPRVAVQPEWLAPLLAGADARTIALPQIDVAGPTAAPEGAQAAALCFCISRELWRELGGLGDHASLEAGLAGLFARLAARGGITRVVPETVVTLAADSNPSEDRGAPRVPRGAPSVGGVGGHVGASHLPISRGLRHVARPSSEYFDFPRPEVAALVPADARRILDVGCGGGALGALLKQQQPQVTVVGIETDAEAAARARTRLDEVLTLDLDTLDELPAPAGSFDCIICADVLEHLMDPERTLAALLRSLREGGTLVASIPNVRHQEVVLDLLVRGRWQYRPAGILDATHLRFYTAEEIAGLLDRLGLVVEVTHASGSEPDPALAPLADVVERLGGDRARFLGESQIIQYIFRARRAAPVARLSVPAAESRTEPAAAKKTSIVVLAWNELEYTRECVKSVMACTRAPYELVLVDNGSRDATLEFFRSVAGAKVVANGANLGFAGGNNRGILAATGDYVVVLNNDTLVTEGWLDGLLACAEEDPSIGIVGPMSNYVSGPQLVPDPAYGDWAGLQAYARAFQQRHRGRRLELDRLVGFCMLIKREVISRVGLLDESFGLGNFEDDDYCLRARQAGFRLVAAGDVFIHHFGSRTFVGQGVDFQAAMRHGQDVFTRKWQHKIAR